MHRNLLRCLLFPDGIRMFHCTSQQTNRRRQKSLKNTNPELERKHSNTDLQNLSKIKIPCEWISTLDFTHMEIHTLLTIWCYQCTDGENTLYSRRDRVFILVLLYVWISLLFSSWELPVSTCSSSNSPWNMTYMAILWNEKKKNKNHGPQSASIPSSSLEIQLL